MDSITIKEQNFVFQFEVCDTWKMVPINPPAFISHHYLHEKVRGNSLYLAGWQTSKLYNRI